MADRKNFFELLPKLIFDPPEKRPAVIQKEIDEFKNNIEQELQNESNPTKKDRLEGLKKLFSEMEAVMDTKNSAYRVEAEAMKAIAVNDFKMTLKVTPGKTVTKGRYNYFRKTFRLNDETVRKVFKEKGIEIRENTLKLPPLLDPVTMNKINDDLKIMRNHKDESGANPQNINDLYWFTAYMKKDLANGGTYSSKSIQMLKRLLEEAIQDEELGRRLDDFGHTLSQLCNTGTTQIFNSDENRKKYDNSLAYESLGELFSTIKNKISPVTRKTPDFAENCIAKIQKVFSDYDEALSIYNKESGLQAEGDPYEPEAITVPCGYCSNVSKFDDQDKAQSVNCPVCGHPFYEKCPKCGKLVLAAAQYCPTPGCNFFIAGAKNYDRYYREAENALDRMDVTEAQKQLGNAKSANPNGPNLASLEQKIKRALDEYEKPLQELRSLISACKLQEAFSKIIDIHSKSPKLDVSILEKKVNNGLEEARKKFSAASSLDPVQKAKACNDILSFCVDFKPALDYMGTTPPEPCPSIKVDLNYETGYFFVSWGHAPDDNITYTLVRKSNGVPSGVTDGTVLLENKVALNFLDKSAEPGKLYGYVVFALRFGTASKGTGMTAVLYHDIDEKKLKKDIGETRCRLSWERPKNCIAVKVTRKEGGIPGPNDGTVVAANAGDYHEDKNLVTGRLYGYRLQALYATVSGTASSAGIVFSVHIVPKAAPLKISVTKSGGIYSFSWDKSQTGFDVRFVQLNENAKAEEGRFYSNDVIRGLGIEIGAQKSEDGAMSLRFEGKAFFNIAAFISADDGGLASNTVSVNTYASCEIEGKPEYSNGGLSIKLKTPLPEKLAYIYYAASQKTPGGQPPWASANDVADMKKITAEGYMKHKEILIYGISEGGDFYITLIPAYITGNREAYADPVRKRWSLPNPAMINWGVKRNLLSNIELRIEFTPSSSVTLLPALALCYGSGYLNSANEKGAVRIIETPQISCGPGKTITKVFPIEKEKTRSLPKKCRVNLFLIDDDLADDYYRGRLSGCDDFI
jgi:tetratricopeptide (TPR) repeat protein